MNKHTLTRDGNRGMEGQSPGEVGLRKEEVGSAFERGGKERGAKDIC